MPAAAIAPEDAPLGLEAAPAPAPEAAPALAAQAATTPALLASFPGDAPAPPPPEDARGALAPQGALAALAPTAPEAAPAPLLPVAPLAGPEEPAVDIRAAAPAIALAERAALVESVRALDPELIVVSAIAAPLDCVEASLSAALCPQAAAHAEIPTRLSALYQRYPGYIERIGMRGKSLLHGTGHRASFDVMLLAVADSTGVGSPRSRRTTA